MDFYNKSLILSLVVRFWDAVIACFRGSILCRICRGIGDAYRNSIMCRLFKARDLSGEAWDGSLLYKFLHRGMNLIPDLLQGRNQTSQNSLKNSRLLPFFGNCVVPVIGFMMLFLLIVPQSRWDNMYSLVIIIFAGALFFLSGLSNETRRFDFKSLGPWPVIFAVVTFFSLLWSKSFSLSFRFFFFGLTCALLVLLIVSATRSISDLHRLLGLSAVGLLIGCVYAVLQNYVGVEADEVLTDLSLHSYMPGRVYSFFENPNSYANILVFFAPVMLTMAVYSPKKRHKLCFAAVFLLCVTALMMTYARGGWLALAFAMFVLMLMLCPRWIPLIIALCFLALPFLPDSILNRLLSIFNMADSSTYTRGYIYSAMLHIIGQNWLFGVGLGASALKFAIEISGVYHASAVFVHAHNIYLQIWAESGIFALIAFLLALFFSMRAGVRGAKSNSPPLLRGIMAGCVSGLAGSLVFGLTDYAWSYPRVMVMFWFIFAVLLAAVKLSRQVNTKEGAEISNG